MSEHLKAWQCIGCGRIEAPQPCLGICQDRKVELVYAFEHEETLARLTETLMQRDKLAALLRRLAFVTPRNGDWESTFRKLQDEARRHLATLHVDVPTSRTTTTIT